MTTSAQPKFAFLPTSTAATVTAQLERQRERLANHALVLGLAEDTENGYGKNGLRRGLLHAHEVLDAAITEMAQDDPRIGESLFPTQLRAQELHAGFSERKVDPRLLPLSRAARRLGEVLWVDRLHLPFVVGHVLALEMLRQVLGEAGLDCEFVRIADGPDATDLLEALPLLTSHESDLHSAIGTCGDLLLELLDEVPYISRSA